MITALAAIVGGAALALLRRSVVVRARREAAEARRLARRSRVHVDAWEGRLRAELVAAHFVAYPDERRFVQIVEVV